MKKLLGLFLLMLVASQAHASSRGSKSVKNLNYITTVSTVTASGSGIVYGVVLSTGTAGTDYLALWDLAATGATAIGSATGLKAKVVVSSTTQNTIVMFDPPLQFRDGIVAANSAATSWSAIIWEPGRVFDR